MDIPAEQIKEKKSDKQEFLAYSAIFTDTLGWYQARLENNYTWRWRGRPRLYFAAHLEYNQVPEYRAIDGLGREWKGTIPFACSINPTSGKFEPLCVQTRNSICAFDNSTWDRTVIRNATPGILRVAHFATGGLPPGKRENIQSWTREDWTSVCLRWLPSAIGIFIIIFLPSQGQPRDKNKQMYLRFLYNGYRYPRLARNLGENRREVRAERRNDAAWSADQVGNYRSFRPRYLCYIENGYYKTKPVLKGDNTPYVFISYSKAGLGGSVGQNPGDQVPNRGTSSRYRDDASYQEAYQFIIAFSIQATIRYFTSNASSNPNYPHGAFWLDSECQPPRIFDENTGRERNVVGAQEGIELTNNDVYSMSDIIRGAKRTIIIALDAGATSNQRGLTALQLWGDRVWTVPEVLLSEGSDVTVFESYESDPRDESKVSLAERAWHDAASARQLLDHYSHYIRLTHLELMSIAVKCLSERRLVQLWRGDLAYALMGLVRIRPAIDATDSSLQAFARLSFPQDSDRLMERLTCLLPVKPDGPWHEMSDQYKSTIWDIFPDIQVCGIGENDTVIVDNFKGAMIQWSMFSEVQTTKRLSFKLKAIVYMTTFMPLIFISACGFVKLSKAAGAILLVISLSFMLSSPAYVPLLFARKLYQVEPCLFGFEGYISLPEIEDNIFGDRMRRLKWSPNGSPLSRHRYPRRLVERRFYGAQQSLSGAPGRDVEEAVYTYPVEGIDPCSPCEACGDAGNTPCAQHEEHLTYAEVKQMAAGPYGAEKIFTLVDTFSMTVTLFKARQPPVALIIGGSEGGMKRALACSYDVPTGTLYRETVLRVPTQSVDRMHTIPRVRLGLNSPYNATDVHPKANPSG